jgi:hypothetical protein
MNQESRYSDVLSDTQAARMMGSCDGRKAGIAEGLRMAAEMFRNSMFEARGSVPFDGYDFHHSILAKAKDVEESI